MDDKERIEMIMQEKNLSNVIFCAKTNISPASLSHIIGGRTKPTLPILRNIIAAFPDLNPEWVFMGTGEMYATTKQNISSDQSMQDSDATLGDDNEQAYIDNQKTSSIDSSNVSLLKDDEVSYSALSGNKSDTQLFNFESSNNEASQLRQHKIPMPSISDIVRETLITVQKPQRNIVEVRIFFDDGTFETFSSNK